MNSLMPKQRFTDEELTEICEDAFVNIKEACMRLQERCGCSNEVVLSMLESVAEFYISKNKPDFPESIDNLQE